MKGKMILSAFFVLMLLLPSLVMFTSLEDDYKKSENRQLTGLDFFSVRQFKNQIINFKNYYTDNFGTRFILYNLYKKNISDRFNESPSTNKIIYGKKNWLFLGDFPDKPFSEAKGSLIFSKIELGIIQKNIREAKKWCDQNNIQFYITIVPGKHSMYKEYLPYKFPKALTKLDQLKELVPNLIDLRPRLNSAKGAYVLYKKKDTHWNQYGAFEGYNVIMKHLKKDNTWLKSLTSKDIYDIKQISSVGDLSRLLGDTIKEKTPRIILKNKKPKKIISTLEVPYYHRLNPSSYEMRYHNNQAINSEKIMFLRDSFSSDLIPFMSVSFQDALFIYNHYFNKELIIKEHPNILVYQMGERVIDRLLNIHQK